jgi:taurine dioxygenase
MTDLIVEPCGPVLGAEVRGLSIGAEGPSEAWVVTLRALLNEHKVLFFRDLELSQQQHLGLGRVWATLENIRSSPMFPAIPRS